MGHIRHRSKVQYRRVLIGDERIKPIHSLSKRISSWKMRRRNLNVLTFSFTGSKISCVIFILVIKSIKCKQNVPKAHKWLTFFCHIWLINRSLSCTVWSKCKVKTTVKTSIKWLLSGGTFLQGYLHLWRNYRVSKFWNITFSRCQTVFVLMTLCSNEMSGVSLVGEAQRNGRCTTLCQSLASWRLTIPTTLAEVFKSGRDLGRKLEKKQKQILFQQVINYFA